MRRLISRSNSRKLIVMMVAIGGLMLAYEATTFDLIPWGAQSGAADPGAPVPGARLDFTATAYCKGTTTASGAEVRTGIAAADDALLPVGSVVNVTTDSSKYNGVYTIMDTGPRVQGHLLDLYMWSCHEALRFGRKPIQVTVLRLGWNPGASAPSLIDRLFRRRERARGPIVPGPIPQTAEAPAGVPTDGEGVPEAAPSPSIPSMLQESSTLIEPAPTAPAVTP